MERVVAENRRIPEESTVVDISGRVLHETLDLVVFHEPVVADCHDAALAAVHPVARNDGVAAPRASEVTLYGGRLDIEEIVVDDLDEVAANEYSELLIPVRQDRGNGDSESLDPHVRCVCGREAPHRHRAWRFRSKGDLLPGLAGRLTTKGYPLVVGTTPHNDCVAGSHGSRRFLNRPERGFLCPRVRVAGKRMTLIDMVGRFSERRAGGYDITHDQD